MVIYFVVDRKIVCELEKGKRQPDCGLLPVPQGVAIEMAIQWLRLWHDMPNDPKWRTIARVSKQSIPEVMAVYIHLLVIASNATERGRTQSMCSEDVASALDLDCVQIDKIIEAMQGRVLDGDYVSGWSKRQVEREDGGAYRAKVWREAKKKEKRTQTNANERKRTPDTDTDTDTDKKDLRSKEFVPQDEKISRFAYFYQRYPKKVARAAAEKAWLKLNPEQSLIERILLSLDQQMKSDDWVKENGKYIPNPATWLNGKRWDDDVKLISQRPDMIGGLNKRPL